MAQTASDDVGKLILRLVLGGCVLLHGIHKLIYGVAPIHGMVHNAGLPDFVTYGVYIGEVLGPVLLIIGYYARVGAALIVINMLFALGLAHMAMLFTLNPMGGWAIELQAMYLFGALALAFTGPGHVSINRS